MSKPHTEESNASHSCGCGSACGSESIELAQPQPEPVGIPVFRIPTMDCASEEGEIRHALASLPGLRSLSFQLAARTIAIDAPAESISQALDAIRKAGFKPVPLAVSGDQDESHQLPSSQAMSRGRFALPEGLPRYALALLLAIGAELIAFLAPHTLVYTGIGMALAASAIGLAGFSTYLKGMAALRNLRLNINALMSVAVTGAFIIGQWPEAAMVMALYAIAELIEARSVDRARNAIKGLLDMTPEKAEVKQADGSWAQTLVKSVAIDAIVRVKPGARVPLDGLIVVGTTSIDQSPVTGESIPVDKAVGDPVFAGTINTPGMFEMPVSPLPLTALCWLASSMQSNRPRDRALPRSNL
jgi:Cd2+/Zn2+-exporting ATPase